MNPSIIPPHTSIAAVPPTGTPPRARAPPALAPREAPGGGRPTPARAPPPRDADGVSSITPWREDERPELQVGAVVGEHRRHRAQCTPLTSRTSAVPTTRQDPAREGQEGDLHVVGHQKVAMAPPSVVRVHVPLPGACRSSAPRRVHQHRREHPAPHAGSLRTAAKVRIAGGRGGRWRPGSGASAAAPGRGRPLSERGSHAIPPARAVEQVVPGADRALQVKSSSASRRRCARAPGPRHLAVERREARDTRRRPIAAARAARLGEHASYCPTSASAGGRARWPAGPAASSRADAWRRADSSS